ncbi:MAG: DNA polymerase III subunit beta [Candidatus Hydrogenedentes bacterium]|nr:DNA polymerase III subunit beta [Candidatus Hydrogenedentota bacterium]
MKITIPRQDLLETVNKVKSVVSSKSALPILSHIMMETGDNVLRMTATDLKVSIECTVECMVEEAGSLTVSSQRLSSILAELPDDDITLTLGDKNVIELRCGRIETRLFSMSPDEFPPIRSFDGIQPLVFQQRTLKNLFTKTSFAICTDQARYNLTGLLLEFTGGRLTVVATDGRRMSLAVEKDAIPVDAEFKVIIPSKMIHELERLLGDDAAVEVLIDESQASFVFDHVRLVTALIEGNFPNYDMVVPKKHDKEAVMDRVKFTEAIRRTRTMTNDKFNSVRFSLENGVVTLKVITPEVGEYQEDLEIDYDGDVVEIAFNPDFVLDVLRRIDSDKVCLVLKDAMSPGVIKPFTEAPQDSFVNVVMPIRI